MPILIFFTLSVILSGMAIHIAILEKRVFKREARIIILRARIEELKDELSESHGG